MGALSNLLDLFFPPKCVFCGKVLKSGVSCVCGKCAAALPYTKGADVSQKGNFFDECVSSLHYEGAVRDSILRFKFKGAVSYADCFGSLLADCIRENLSGRYNLITWAPLEQQTRPLARVRPGDAARARRRAGARRRRGRNAHEDSYPGAVKHCRIRKRGAPTSAASTG
jgi:hypothetical protein